MPGKKAISAYELFMDESRKRRQAVLKMHNDGVSMRKIAEQIGVSPQRVFSIIKRARAEQAGARK